MRIQKRVTPFYPHAPSVLCVLLLLLLLAIGFYRCEAPGLSPKEYLFFAQTATTVLTNLAEITRDVPMLPAVAAS